MSETQTGWHLVKVGDLLTEYSERSTSSNQHEVLSVTKDGIFSQREYFKKQIASEDNSGYKVVRKGDIVFSAMNLWMGSIDVVKDQEIGIVSPAYITMRPTEGLIDTDFLGYFLRGDEMRRKYVQHSQQGASIVRRNLNKDDLLGDAVEIPPLPEQKKIADILSGIDKQVLDLRVKSRHIRSSKKSVFGDFLAGRTCAVRRLGVDEWNTGLIDQAQFIPASWEIVNINTVAQLETGHTPSRKCSEYWGGEIPWISLADAKQLELEHAIYETSENTNPQGISNSSARLLPEGTVCLSRTASVGKSVIMGREMATSQDFANFICGPRLDPYFLMFLFRYMQGTWKALSGGSTHQTIYMNEILKHEKQLQHLHVYFY